jgi:hypothetical protein
MNKIHCHQSTIIISADIQQQHPNHIPFNLSNNFDAVTPIHTPHPSKTLKADRFFVPAPFWAVFDVTTNSLHYQLVPSPSPHLNLAPTQTDIEWNALLGVIMSKSKTGCIVRPTVSIFMISSPVSIKELMSSPLATHISPYRPQNNGEALCTVSPLRQKSIHWAPCRCSF